MSGPLRRWAAGLFDQQLWCWVRDVVRPDGNILLDLGMCRYRSPGSEPGGTAYTGRAAGDAVIWLWGFGLMYADPDRGAVFIRRFGFDPMWVASPPRRPVHRPEDLGPLTRPGSGYQRQTVGVLLKAAAGWVARYEHWVSESIGSVYREATLAARGQKARVPAREMASAWELLAKKAARVTGSVPSRRGPWGEVFDRIGTAHPVMMPTRQPFRRPARPVRVDRRFAK